MFMRELRRLLIELPEPRFWAVVVTTFVVAIAVIFYKLS